MPHVAVDRHQVPTLLVGLGGIGSRLVERVYLALPEGERDRIALHVIDTDVNDLVKREHFAPPSRHTGIGDARLVGVLRSLEPDIDDWLPTDSTIDRRSTIDGAGQVRSLGRLAMTTMLRESDLAGLSSAVDRLYDLYQSEGESYDPRVMIVSSLAGGTGTGTFLQTALLCKTLIRQKIIKLHKITVRGTFVLPEVLTANDLLPRAQRSNVAANAMSAIKELEAIGMSIVGLGPSLALEYEPGGETRTVEERPYDYLFMLDYRNANNHTLPTFEAYLEQASRILHLALFSPLKGPQFSVEDNNVLGLIDTKDRARYASAATMSLRYPYDDVLDYLVASWATKEIDDHWVAPDVDYAEQLAKYKKALENHVQATKPDRSRHFRSYIEERATDPDATDPFYRTVHLQAHVDNHEGRVGTPRSTGWIDAIEERVRTVCRSAGTQALGGALPIDPIALRRPQTVRSHVTDVERHLARARTRAVEFVKGNVDSIVNGAMKLDGERAWLAKGSGAHRINFWLFDDNGPLHPLAVRYVLYEVEESLTARIASRHESPREVRALRDAHEAKYDDPATPERETAVDRASEVLQRGLLARLLRKNALEDFADAYESDARRHYDDLQHHLELALRREVFRRLQGEVGAFLQEWEGFFAQLSDVRDDFAAEAIRGERFHDEQNDGTTEYVLATAEHKQGLWSGVREAIEWTQDDDVSRIAYDGVYRYYLDTRHERRDRAVTPFVERVREALRSRLVAMPQHVPTSIGEALRREAEFAGVDVAKHARARIEEIPKRAVPFLQLRPTQNHDIAAFEFWGVHPETLDTLPDAARAAIAQVTDDDTDPAFSVHDLIFYRSRYLIEATDLASFTPGRQYGTMRDVDGPYYLSYRERIAKMLGGGVTPHLDTTWDAALPDFWDERYFAARVMIQGLATGVVRSEKRTWVASVPSTDKPTINEDLKLTDSGNRGSLSYLLDAVARSEGLDRIAREVGNVAKQRQHEDQARYGTQLHHHRFVRAIRRLPSADGSLFALIAESYVGAPDLTPATRSARVQSLFRTFADILAAYVATVEGDEDRARRRIHEILEKGLEDAFTEEASRLRGVPSGMKTSLRELVGSYAP